MKKQLIIITSAVLVFGLNGCSKHYFDINTNPNTATNTTPELVLPNALTVTANGVETNFNFLSAWLGYYGQSGSYATGVGDIASYKQTTTFGDGIFQAKYRNLEDYDYVEKAGLLQKKYFHVAAAKIMKAYVFQQLVDMFNNVPYTQAFLGTNIINPKYDDAQTIYNAITLQIDSAIALMQRPDAIGTANSDVLIGGKNATWIQFGNSLKLRILIQQSQVTANATFVQGELAKITANGGGFLTTDAGVNPGYANNAGQQNPIWGFYVTLTGNPTSGGGADFWKANQYSIDWLTNHNDPRLKFIYSPGSGGTYVGSVLGGGSNPAGTGASSVGPGVLKSVSQPSVIMSAAESYLLQAEAFVRGWLPGGTAAAQTAFNNGVQASFNYLGAGSSAAYVAQNDKQTNFGATTNQSEQLAAIVRQKWIANDAVTPLQAWDDYRRLHLPADLPISISPYLDIPGSQIPVRILYPISEYQTNAVNVNAQGTIDYHASKIFWNQ
jgi:hypothetical protein